MTTKPWSERTKTTEQLVMETMGPLSQIPGIRVIPIVPPPLPGGGDFPVDFVIASAAEPQQLSEIANQLVQKAFASGLFIFADADLKFDQPQAEVVFDRDKLRSQGVDLSQAGLDLSTLLGGDYVNRFSIQGRSYKVIPQIKRAERLSPEQLTDIYVTGSGNQLVPLSTFATLANHHPAARAEEIPAAQRGPHTRCDPASRSARSGAALPRGRSARHPASRVHDRLRGRVAPAADGGRQVPRHVPVVGDPDLSRARGAVRELPRSVHHPRGVGAARDCRRAAVFVPRIHEPEHLQPGRAHHAGRSRVEERHPHRAVRQPSAGNRQRQAGVRSSKPRARGCARS